MWRTKRKGTLTLPMKTTCIIVGLLTQRTVETIPEGQIPYFQGKYNSLSFFKMFFLKKKKSVTTKEMKVTSDPDVFL